VKRKAHQHILVANNVAFGRTHTYDFLSYDMPRAITEQNSEIWTAFGHIAMSIFCPNAAYFSK